LNLAVFDHEWSQRPDRPPLVTLQHKDWQDQLVVDHPLDRLQVAAAMSSSRPPPPPSDHAETNGQDDRLATAFEACQDLLFLSTPLEGLDFALHLFEDLAEAEAKTACLYDIDDDVYRVAAAQGPGSDDVRGKAIPFRAGFFGVASQTPRAALVVSSPTDDARFDPTVDGRDGVEVRNALYLPLTAEGRQLGMIQLLNRQSDTGFTQADADLATYVGQQLSSFLYQARLKGTG
jgi:GAF domain-containing protein